MEVKQTFQVDVQQMDHVGFPNLQNIGQQYAGFFAQVECAAPIFLVLLLDLSCSVGREYIPALGC